MADSGVQSKVRDRNVADEDRENRPAYEEVVGDPTNLLIDAQRPTRAPVSCQVEGETVDRSDPPVKDEESAARPGRNHVQHRITTDRRYSVDSDGPVVPVTR